MTRYHYTPTRIAEIKKTKQNKKTVTMLNANKDANKLDFIY